MPRTHVVVALLLFVCCVRSGLAQTQTGSIAGVVRDEQGAVLPGVTVTLTTRIGNRTTTTGPGGEYRFVALDPGTYGLQAELSGFRAIRQENIVLQLGEQLQVSLVLRVAEVTESVVVTGEASVVDVSTSSTANAISQTLLAAVPITRTNAATQIMNYAPGINAGSAFGGDPSANALLLDGVDTRNPASGGAYTFFNYNIVEEVQVSGLGAPAEMGGFTGAVVNTITNSGGNTFAGLFELIAANSRMSDNNVAPEIARLNAALTDTAKIKKLTDYTVQLGGPVVKNRVFFFTSTQRYYLDTDPSGALTLRHEVSPRFNFKVTALPSAHDALTLLYQIDDYNTLENDAGGNAISYQLDSPEYLTLIQWRRLFGSRAFGEVKYTGWAGYLDFDPVSELPSRFDAGTGLSSGGAGQIDYGTRSRQQVNGAFTRYATAGGEHTFKVGVEIERSEVRDQRSFVGGATYEDTNGRPTFSFVSGFDRRSRNVRGAAYAQDSWRLRQRVTINAGVRLDTIRGISDTRDVTVYDTTSVAPRLGFAWNMTGNDRSVVKATYGQYYENAITRAYARGIGGDIDSVTYDLTGAAPVEIGRIVAPVYRIDPDIDHPRTDEFSVSFERAIRSDLRVAVTGVHRAWKNALNSVLPEARWTPLAFTNPLTNAPMTAYRLTNPAQATRDLLIANTHGFQYLDQSGNPLGAINTERRYTGLSLVLSKRFNGRYQFQASYVASKAEDSGGNVLGGNAQFESIVSGFVNQFGDTGRPHEFKLLGSYLVPRLGVMASGYYQLLSGTRYTPLFQLTNAQTNTSAAGLGAAARQILLEPRGSRLTPNQSLVDLRLEKVLKLPDSSELSLFVDVQNLLNAGTVTGVQSRVPSTLIGGFPDPVVFGSPSTLTTARQAQIGARWKFADSQGAAGGPAEAPRRFWTSRKGMAVLAVLGAGVGYGVYSKVHDRIHSKNPDR